MERDAEGGTALHSAAGDGKTMVVSALLDAGVEVLTAALAASDSPLLHLYLDAYAFLAAEGGLVPSMNSPRAAKPSEASVPSGPRESTCRARRLRSCSVRESAKDGMADPGMPRRSVRVTAAMVLP